VSADPAGGERGPRWQDALRRHQAGDLDGADALYRALLAGRPGDDALLTKRALVALQRGDLPGALALSAAALDANPRNVEARLWNGEALRQSGDAAAAADLLRAAVADAPALAPAWFNLGLAEDARGAGDAARVAFERFTLLRPDEARGWRELGRLALRRRAVAEAAAAIERQARCAPHDANACFDAGLAHERRAALTHALAWFAKAAALDPARADVRNAQGVAHFNLAEHDEALRRYEEALALDPSSRDVHANLLMALHHAHPPDPSRIAAAHARAAACLAAEEPAAAAGLGGTRDPERTLRVGYVSPRFCAGPLAHMMLPLLERHDRDRYEVHGYATSAVCDEATAAMRAHAFAWHDVHGLDDGALAARIRDDRIDILVDLAGHCPGNSLGTFALRAAPVQLTWLDYVDTTAVPAMDYFVADDLHVPPGSAQRFTEAVARLPRIRFVYRATTILPDVVPPPVLARGAVTFGCFNRLAKIGPPVVDAWSAILSGVPGARLVLKATALASDDVQDLVRTRFAARGVDPSRLLLRSFSDEATMLAEYADVDIALDPFPYSGCNTTCDALSMGVPVVTLRGRAIAGLHSTAILSTCGQHATIASDVDAYVALAQRLAGDVPRLVALRGSLRAAIRGSAVMDERGFARDFETLLRDAWRRACASAPAAASSSAGTSPRPT
jgi:predicted O-linked N-acetylglucosamine transferase (SPINDLY family)